MTRMGRQAVTGNDVILQRPHQEPEVIRSKPPKPPHTNGPEYLIHCLETGEPIHGFCSMEVSRDAQEILEAGKRAADSGQTQNLPLI